MAKLTVNCMECSEQLELGEFDDAFIADIVTGHPWMLTSTICDPCLKSKHDIDVDQILRDIDEYERINAWEDFGEDFDD